MVLSVCATLETGLGDLLPDRRSRRGRQRVRAQLRIVVAVQEAIDLAREPVAVGTVVAAPGAEARREPREVGLGPRA